jgi:cation transport ATPase
MRIAINLLELDDVFVTGADEAAPTDRFVIHSMIISDQHVIASESTLVEREIGTQVFAATELVEPPD